ncbi:type II toxin-antitoxin system VapB family antitoxin [Myxococcota bacterium]|nr:type II toxin-antitoxin system VapB family antitoxin [Myxococcota bacterium]
MRRRRTTLDLDAELLAEAERNRKGMTRTATIEEALRALIARDAAERLAALGGSARDARAPRRRRVDEAR